MPNQQGKNGIFIIIGVLAAFGILAILGYALPKANEGNESTPHEDTENSEERAHDLAPDFTLPTLSGGTISLSDYRGNKPVILDFWASWCPHCQRSMPRLNGWYSIYKDHVAVIGVNMNESREQAQKFVDSRNIQFPIVLDTGAVQRQFGIQYTNIHVLINTAGEVVRVIPGDIQERDIRLLLGT